MEMRQEEAALNTDAQDQAVAFLDNFR